MNGAAKTKQKTEFGDFQTPLEFAREVCEAVAATGFKPQTIVEPTCGVGNFLAAACDKFSENQDFFGFDVSPEYIAAATARFQNKNIRLRQIDFFSCDWAKTFDGFAAPVLVVGNPPWVTNSGLSRINGVNAPAKTNFQNFNGFDALTGKSNFDVSEWILIRLFETLKERPAVLAMLCKTGVARKLFVYAAKNKFGCSRFEIRRINALEHFGVAADACLLLCVFDQSAKNTDCRIFANLTDVAPLQTIGFRDNQLLAAPEKFERLKHLSGGNAQTKWRSGVKHDCAKVMELVAVDGKFQNGFGEIVELEPDFVFPLLKSSDLSNGCEPRKFVVVTQESTRDDTAKIAERAPKTWNYLLAHAALLDCRASRIYRNRARFSIFGVGDYSFSQWKVAISGLYKKLVFRVVGNETGKPVMLDDTCYFLPASSRAEAREIAALLNSEIAREFYEAFVFWDAKRPITVEILQKLALSALQSSRDGKTESLAADAPREQ